MRITQQEEVVELNVGAIVVATGFQMWDSSKLSQYSYGKSPNIITALEFERLSNASGPTGGQIITADGEKPERVATVAIGNARNAGLLAVRMLGIADPDLVTAMAAYQDEMNAQAKAKNANLTR